MHLLHCAQLGCRTELSTLLTTSFACSFLGICFSDDGVHDVRHRNGVWHACSCTETALKRIGVVTAVVSCGFEIFRPPGDPSDPF